MMTVFIVYYIVVGLIASFHWAFLNERRREAGGFKRLKFTYLDVLLFVLESPVILILSIVVVPIALLGTAFLYLVTLTRPELWVEWIEVKCSTLGNKLNSLLNKSKIIRALRQPIKKEEK